MKIGGVEAKKSGPLPPLVLKGGRAEELVFYAEPVHDLEEFNVLCPKPDVSKFGMFGAGGNWEANPADPRYIDAIEHWYKLRWAYIVIKSLTPSKIEWSKVELRKPETWLQYKHELADVLSYNEYGLLIGLINEANALDAEKLEENRATFFQKLAKRDPAPNGQSGEAVST